MMSYGFWRKSEFIRIPPPIKLAKIFYGGGVFLSSVFFWVDSPKKKLKWVFFWEFASFGAKRRGFFLGLFFGKIRPRSGRSFFWDYFLGKSKCWKTYFRWISKTSQMLSKLSKNQQRNTQKPKFSRLRRSQEQKVIQMCLYLYLYYKIILSELFLGIIFWENPAAKRPEFFFWDYFLGKFSFRKIELIFGKIPKT